MSNTDGGRWNSIIFQLKETNKYLHHYSADSLVEQIYLFYEDWSTETFRKKESKFKIFF